MSKLQYLALGVLHRGRLYRNSIVSADGGDVMIRVQDAPLLDRAIMRVDRYLSANSLYLSDSSPEADVDTPVLLLLPRR